VEATARKPFGPVHSHCLGRTGCRSVVRSPGDVRDRGLGGWSGSFPACHRDSTDARCRPFLGWAPRSGVLSTPPRPCVVAGSGRYVRRLERFAPRTDPRGPLGSLLAGCLAATQRVRAEVPSGDVQWVSDSGSPRRVSKHYVRFSPRRFPADGYRSGARRHTRFASDHRGPHSARMGWRRHPVTNDRRPPVSRCDTWRQAALIAGAGHVSNLEQPARFEAEVRNFCRSVPIT